MVMDLVTGDLLEITVAVILTSFVDFFNKFNSDEKPPSLSVVDI
ncbi:hypothetical protein BAT_2944 [Bacillus pumilus ATCC 7061]|nr:hypothetical protein BAT_2944 [Bacillus pumilus ATCC 7061]